MWLLSNVILAHISLKSLAHISLKNHDYGGSHGNRILDRRQEDDKKEKVLAFGKPESDMLFRNLRCHKSLGFPESLKIGQQSSKSISFASFTRIRYVIPLKYNQFAVMKQKMIKIAIQKVFLTQEIFTKLLSSEDWY